eukprot:scaffold163822_cov28-Prasinocladus_malaysianus.AAC.1
MNAERRRKAESHQVKKGPWLVGLEAVGSLCVLRQGRDIRLSMHSKLFSISAVRKHELRQAIETQKTLTRLLSRAHHSLYVAVQVH